MVPGDEIDEAKTPEVPDTAPPVDRGPDEQIMPAQPDPVRALFERIHRRLCNGPYFETCQNEECVEARRLMGE